jgi:hypothetical protein
VDGVRLEAWERLGITPTTRIFIQACRVRSGKLKMICTAYCVTEKGPQFGQLRSGSVPNSLQSSVTVTDELGMACSVHYALHRDLTRT